MPEAIQIATYIPTLDIALPSKVKQSKVPKVPTTNANGHLNGRLISGYLKRKAIIARHTTMNEDKAPTLDKVPMIVSGIKPAIIETITPNIKVAT